MQIKNQCYFLNLSSMSSYKLVYDDGAISATLIDRKIAKDFAKYMNPIRSVNSMLVLIKSKIKCEVCNNYPVWNEKDLCPSCYKKQSDGEMVRDQDKD